VKRKDRMEVRRISLSNFEGGVAFGKRKLYEVSYVFNWLSDSTI